MGRPRLLRPRTRRLLRATLLAAVGLVAIPAVSLAHPLGNFTINHFAELRVGADGIALQVVIDQAEIPAFQARQAMDADGDGNVTETERATGATMACADLTGSLDLRIDGVRQPLAAGSAGLSFPPGVGGLPTMRLTCDYAVDGPLRAGSAVVFADASYAERIGWREIVVVGAASGPGLRPTTVSDRLTAYPAELLARPLDDRSVAFEVAPVATVADPVPMATAAVPDLPSVAVPGGVIAGELPSILRAADLTPVVLLLSLLTAAALGAGHALTPGHGKTLMAAYLVGTRGTPLHAVALGLSVTVSHTLGILVLAAVVVGAQGVLAPDVVVRGAPIIAAISIVAIGGWMLLGEVRRRRAAAAHTEPDDHEHPHDHEHGHGHAHEHEHAHGGIAHSHRPPAGTTITWRGLFALGLAGGLIPSTSALLILLGSIAAGRPAFGFVLVVAFGIGMAAVMAGIGIALVLARGRLDRVDARSPLGRAGAVAPLVAAILVFGLGCYLTVQAVGGAPTL